MRSGRYAANDDELYAGLDKTREKGLQVSHGARLFGVRAAPRIWVNAVIARCNALTRSSGVKRNRSIMRVRSIPKLRAASMAPPGRG